MNIVLYPNNEIRLRVPTVAAVKRTERVSLFVGKVPTSYLSIAENLQKASPDAIKPKAVRIGMAPGYGGRPKGTEFSVRGRRLMVRAGALLGTGGYGSNNLFLTGTLPGSTDEAMSVLAEWSSYTVHLLLTRLPQLAQVPASECRWIWCWEYQKRGALHWHCVLKLPDWQSRDRVLHGFTSVWNSVLSGVAKKSGVDIFARDGGGTWKDEPEAWISRAEILRKRADKYLAKYLSKQAGKDASTYFPPTRWYGLNRALHNEFRESVINLQTHVSNEVRHETTELDLDLLGGIQSSSSSFFYYPDKVGTGMNFVAYFDDEEYHLMKENIIMRVNENARENAFVSSKKRDFDTPALAYIGLTSWQLQRFLADIGSFYRGVYYDWVDIGRVDSEDDLWWL